MSIENNGLLNWRPKGHKQIITIAVPAKYRLPARFPQPCHRVFHKNRVVVLGRASSNPHLHEAAILGSCVPKPLSQTDASDVPRRYFEFVPTVEDLERIVPYGARDSRASAGGNQGLFDDDTGKINVSPRKSERSEVVSGSYVLLWV